LTDQTWRINSLYKIIDKDANLVTFKLNFSQAKFHYEAHNRSIILKARQLGFTTYSVIRALDFVIFSKNFTAVIIAHDKESLKKIFKKVQLAWDQFDKRLKDELGIESVASSTNELRFNNRSSIRVTLSSRSDTVNYLHVSEFGKICNKYPAKADEIVSGAFNSVPKDGHIVIESTAEGDFGYFHDFFQEAWERGAPQHVGQFKSFFFPWWDEPGYRLRSNASVKPQHLKYQAELGVDDEQINWYAWKQEEQKELMLREYPSNPGESFRSSGAKLFSIEATKWQVQWVREPVSISGDWKYYDKYKSNHFYIIGADVAEGMGQDSSTAVILDCKSMEVVATYKNNTIEPHIFAYELFKASQAYGNCLIVPERNNCGITTVDKLRELGAVLYFKEETDPSNPTKKVRRFGWRTTGSSKPLMFYNLHEVMEENEVKIIDKVLLRECETYDREDLTQWRFDADQTKHWDLLIAFAIAIENRSMAIFRQVKRVDKNYKPKKYAPRKVPGR